MNDVSTKKAASAQPFLSDVKALREQARKHIEQGPVTKSYGGDT